MIMSLSELKMQLTMHFKRHFLNISKTHKTYLLFNNFGINVDYFNSSNQNGKSIKIIEMCR